MAKWDTKRAVSEYQDILLTSLHDCNMVLISVEDCISGRQLAMRFVCQQKDLAYTLFCRSCLCIAHF
jgi:hypothetical protein